MPRIPVTTPYRELASHQTTSQQSECRSTPSPRTPSLRGIDTSPRTPSLRGSVTSSFLPRQRTTPSTLPSTLPLPDPNSHSFVPDFLYENRNDLDILPKIKKISGSVRRNAVCLELQNKQDCNLLSKCHLPKHLSDLFGPAFVGTDDEQFSPPPWLLESVSKVVSTLTSTPAAPPFRFSSDDANVTYNTELLRINDFDLTKIIEENQHTSLCYGSEF